MRPRAQKEFLVTCSAAVTGGFWVYRVFFFYTYLFAWPSHRSWCSLGSGESLVARVAVAIDYFSLAVFRKHGARSLKFTQFSCDKISWIWNTTSEILFKRPIYFVIFFNGVAGEGSGDSQIGIFVACSFSLNLQDLSFMQHHLRRSQKIFSLNYRVTILTSNWFRLGRNKWREVFKPLSHTLTVDWT